MGNEPKLIAEIDALRRENATKDEEIRAIKESSEQEIRLLKEQMALLMAKVFGKRSEKFDPNQLGLFEEETVVAQEPDEFEDIAAHKRKKKKSGHGRKPFPDHLPRNEIICDLSEDEKTCDDCQAELNVIGQDLTERGHLIPAQWLVNQYVKIKYGCPKGHQVKSGKAPEPVLDRCKFEPSVYASIAVSKFVDHLPLNRQEAIFRRHGFSIPRSTMGDMLQRLVEIAGDPIIEQMKKEIVAESFIQADETPITVLKEGTKGSSQGFLWVYRTMTKVLFDFREDRKRDGPSAFLKDFRGTLQSDGYSGYNEIVVRNQLVRVGCWSHARRKFNDALKSAKAHAGPMMILMQELFRIEAAMKKRRDERELTDEEFYELRTRVRQARSVKVIDEIRTLLLDLDMRPSVLPKSEIGKAVHYAMNQWKTLVAFLEHPEAELDNNAAERAIRQVALGRKNYMFAGSAKGGHAAAVLYSLVGTCKVLDINPQDYLEDVLMKVSTTPTSKAHTLTPWAWAAAQPKN